jgi:hypothetical protein
MAKARVWKNRVTIICPACRDIERAEGYTDIAGEHAVPFAGDGAEPRWQFDGNLERPTLAPSLLRTYTVTGESTPKLVCHSFVRNGRIEYLNDCTHAMRGQTVDLPELPAAAE